MTSVLYSNGINLTKDTHTNLTLRFMRVKVFRKGPSKVCRRQPLKFLKGFLLKILLGTLLHTLTHMMQI